MCAMETDLKRKWCITWDQYFMGVAMVTSQRSKDPNRQVGSCIVNEDNRILSTGYNGMPNGCDDSLMPWGRGNKDTLKNKQLYACHSELNAILNRGGSVKGCTIYVTLFPCNECAKALIQSGIKEVIYYSDIKAKEKPYIASRRMLGMANVKIRKYVPTNMAMTIGHFHSKL